MNVNPPCRKLQVKPGMKLTIINAPPGYTARLDPLPQRVALVSRPRWWVAAVQLFVADSRESKRLRDRARRWLVEDGRFWICRPKQSSQLQSDFNRDELARQVSKWGLRAVTCVSIDDTWSALRFRPAR